MSNRQIFLFLISFAYFSTASGRFAVPRLASEASPTTRLFIPQSYSGDNEHLVYGVREEKINSILSQDDICQTQSTLSFCKEGKSGSANGRSGKRRMRFTSKDIQQEIKNDNTTWFNDKSFDDINLALDSIEDLQELKNWSQWITKQKTCLPAPVQMAFASRWENEFPEAESMNQATALFNKTFTCHDEEWGSKARFRWSLMQIWQGRCDLALPEMQSLTMQPTAQSFQSRSLFWVYQCSVHLGKTAEAEVAKETLMLKYPLSFHNISVNGFDPRMQNRVFSGPMAYYMRRSVIRPDVNIVIQQIEERYRKKQFASANDLIETALPDLLASETEVRLYIAALISRNTISIPQFRLLSSVLNSSTRFVNADTLKLFFPLGYLELLEKQSGDVDPLLFAALIRQESAFNVRARSPVGARGLMQVMPATARHIASVRSKTLYDPHTNVKVGTKYFQMRLAQLGGDVELTLAAYNAGIHRVEKWIKRYPVDQRHLFFDLIPFKETRDYVANILRNYYWYLQLYKAQGLHSVENYLQEHPVSRKTLAIMNAQVDPSR